MTRRAGSTSATITNTPNAAVGGNSGTPLGEVVVALEELDVDEIELELEVLVDVLELDWEDDEVVVVTVTVCVAKTVDVESTVTV